MFDSVLFGFICLLAVYGGFSILFGIIEERRFRPAIKSNNVRVAIIVKDAEENIEAIVRNAFSYDFQGRALSAHNIAVVDLGSSDDTLRILGKMGSNNQCIDIYTVEDKCKVFSDLS
jgi:hypothetical protein